MSQASGGDEALWNEQNEAGEELDQLGGLRVVSEQNTSAKRSVGC